LSLVFVSHDLAVVKVMSDRVAVMYRGRIVEIGPADSVYGSPSHPYTRRLLDAVPVLDPSERAWESARVDDDAEWRTVDRELVEIAPGHFAALGAVVHDGERVP